MKFAATIARSCKPTCRRSCASIERAVAIGTRDAGRGLKTELRRQAASVLSRQAARRGQLVFRDWGRYGRRSAAQAGSHGCGDLPQSASMFSSHRIFISVSIGASAGSNKMASMPSAGCKKMASTSVSIGASAGSCAHAGVEQRSHRERAGRAPTAGGSARAPSRSTGSGRSGSCLDSSWTIALVVDGLARLVQQARPGADEASGVRPSGARRSGQGLTTVVMFLLVPQVKLRSGSTSRGRPSTGRHSCRR